MTEHSPEAVELKQKFAEVYNAAPNKESLDPTQISAIVQAILQYGPAFVEWLLAFFRHTPTPVPTPNPNPNPAPASS